MSNKKVVLVVGASSDVGISLIDEINADSSIILAHYNHKSEELSRLKERIGEKLILLQADLSNQEHIARMIQQIDQLGIYPNQIVYLAAPKFIYKQFRKLEWEDYRVNLEICIESAYLILKNYLPIMANEKYGRVVFMLTSCIVGQPPKFLSHYVTAKYALEGFMKSLAVEYANKGITVNGISPDMMNTKFLSDVPGAIVEQAREAMPNKALLEVTDVTPVIHSLLSDEFNKINGQNIVISGGTK